MKVIYIIIFVLFLFSCKTTQRTPTITKLMYWKFQNDMNCDGAFMKIDVNGKNRVYTTDSGDRGKSILLINDTIVVTVNGGDCKYHYIVGDIINKHSTGVISDTVIIKRDLIIVGFGINKEI